MAGSSVTSSLVKPTLVGACLLVGHLFMASVTTAAEPAAPKEIGLPVGQNAPAFKLNDQADSEVSLEALLKKGPVALVFYRSADW